MNTFPLVTIITSTFNLKKNNRLNSMKRCIDSVIMQDYQNIEYIIIDNDSNDGTLEFLNQYKNKLKVYSEKDNGIYDAFNKGINKANGKYIAFLGSDDMYAGNDVISKMVEKLEETNSDWLYGDAYYIYKDKILLWKGKLSYLIFGSSPCHQSTMFSVNSLKSIGCFSSKVWAFDTLSMVKLFVNGYKSCYLNKVLSIFSANGQSSKICYQNKDYINSFINEFYNIVKDKTDLTIKDCKKLYLAKCYTNNSIEELILLSSKLKFSEWIKGLLEKDITVFNKECLTANKYEKLSLNQIKRKIFFYKILYSLYHNKKYKNKILILKNFLKDKNDNICF